MPKRLIDEVKSEHPEHTKQICDLERKLAAAKQDKEGYRNKYEETAKALAVAESSLELFRATRGDFDPYKATTTKSKRTGRATAVIIATDWHAEERVDLKTTNGKNEFNLEIAERRIRQLWDKSILLTEAARNLADIDECVLAFLGDAIGGHIHEELAESNFLSPFDATRWVQRRMYEGVETLRQRGRFKRIRVVGVSGNHSRDTKRIRVSTRERHSYENFAYHNLADRFEKAKDVEFSIADGILTYLDVEGRIVRFTHGDAINFGGGVGGLGIPANKKIHKWDQTTRADYTYFGHWHQFLWQGNWIACPTLKGFDPFSLWIGANCEPPAQLFSVIDSERGLTEVKPIFVDPPTK